MRWMSSTEMRCRRTQRDIDDFDDRPVIYDISFDIFPFMEMYLCSSQIDD